MDGIVATKHRGEVAAYLTHLAAADVGIEDLLEDRLLLAAQELLVIQVAAVADDGVVAWNSGAIRRKGADALLSLRRESPLPAYVLRFHMEKK